MENTWKKRIPAFLTDMTVAGTFIRLSANFIPLNFKATGFEIFNLQFQLSLSLAFVIYLCYFIFFDIICNGRTPGKLITGIRTVSKSGKELRLKKRIVRSCYKMLSIMLLPVSVILFLFKNHYTIQDHCADTITTEV